MAKESTAREVLALELQKAELELLTEHASKKEDRRTQYAGLPRDVVLYAGYLEKNRPRGFRLIWQKRWFQLTQDSLTWWYEKGDVDAHNPPAGSINVLNITHVSREAEGGFRFRLRVKATTAISTSSFLGRLELMEYEPEVRDPIYRLEALNEIDLARWINEIKALTPLTPMRGAEGAEVQRVRRNASAMVYGATLTRTLSTRDSIATERGSKEQAQLALALEEERLEGMQRDIDVTQAEIQRLSVPKLKYHVMPRSWLDF